MHVGQGSHDLCRTKYRLLSNSQRKRRQVPDGCARFVRKAQALARSPLHLQQLLLAWLAYYHLTRPHASLRLPKSKQPIPKLRDRTPARAQPPCGMAAGVVDAVWSFLRFLRTPSFPSLIHSANIMHMAC